MINRFFYFIFFGGFTLIMGCNPKHNSNSLATDAVIAQSIAELRIVLHTQSEWVKVHAAEFLIWSGHPKGVEEEFLKENQEYNTKPQYRIGIWRVLAQAANTPEEKHKWTNKILQAFLDVKGKDRIHAAETLAKLKISPVKENPEIAQKTIADTLASLSLYTQWSVGYTSKDSLDTLRERFFKSLTLDEKSATPSSNQALMAYVLRHIGGLSAEQWTILNNTAMKAPTASNSRINILSAAYVNTPKDSMTSPNFHDLHTAFLKYADAPEKGARTEMINALSIKGNEADLPLLIAILNSENPIGKEADDADIKASAAYAILSISSRIKEQSAP